VTRTLGKSALLTIVLTALMATLGAGCADMSALAGTPRVEDCGVVSISSPNKYVCGGKVYTAFQLATMREAEKKKYESGQ